MTSNTLIFLENELPQEYFDEVNRWAEQLGAETEPEYAHIEIAVYNLWKYRRARNASAVAINAMTRRQRHAYEQRQADRVRQLTGQIDLDARAVVSALEATTGGLRWLLVMLENHLLALMTGDLLTAAQRLELIRVFGLMPHTLFFDRDVMQIQLDCLALHYGKGGLTATQAAELLDDSRGARTPEEFVLRLEPHLAGMATQQEARQYLITMIQKRCATLTALLPAAEARENRELAQEIALAKCDISDPGYRREQYQSMADNTRHRALRDFHTLQEVRRKHGAGDPEATSDPQPQVPAGTGAAADGQAAPAEEAAPAAAVPDKNDPTVTQATGEPKGCGAETVQPDHPRYSEFSGTFAQIMAMAALYEQPLAEEERRE